MHVLSKPGLLPTGNFKFVLLLMGTLFPTTTLGRLLLILLPGVIAGNVDGQESSQTFNQFGEGTKTPYHEQTIAWQQEHEAKFRRPYGWLSLVGHIWLKPGDNTLGSDTDSDIRLPLSSQGESPIAGVLTVQGTSVRWAGRSNHRFTVDGEIRNRYTFQIDPLMEEADATSPLLIEDRYQIQLVRRAGRLAVRVRDPESALRREFPGKVWYPVQEKFRVLAQYQSFREPLRLQSSNVRGMNVETQLIGQAEWTMEGKTFRMSAMEEGEELFFVFRDKSCGNSSYSACRFLNVPKPNRSSQRTDNGDENDATVTEIVLDFNRTYNPPCAFSEHTLCPLPPPENTLDIPILAGEGYRPRSKRLTEMEKVMGPIPTHGSKLPLDVQVHADYRIEGYTRRKISFAVDQEDRTPAWLLIPDHAKGNPAMLCLHQTISMGKDEPVGLGLQVSKHQAVHLVHRGYVCIVPDYPSFGEYDYDFPKAFASGQYQSGTAKAIWNNMRAIDVLCSLPEVDSSKIGAIGHSLGGHNSLFTAAFDERIRVAVSSCGFCSFHHYYGGDLKGWTSDRYMPKIASAYGSDPQKMPFDFDDVLMAIYPRSIFVMAPKRDSNFDFAGVRRVIDAVAPAYEKSGFAQRLQVVHPDTTHDWPEPEREQAYDFVDRVLKANAESNESK